ncbi:MAG: hypothetical protein HY795_14240 [Desulfovibrio sp.]|nr:hypothetical protein [Desulfovibrio sp.]MBI4959449.1 hypothetical protein [Desulfovibrio sp.]
MAAPKVLRPKASASLLACAFLLILSTTVFSQSPQTTDASGQAATNGQSAPADKILLPDGAAASPSAAVTSTPTKRSKPKAQTQESPVAPSITQQETNSSELGNSQPMVNGIKDFGSKASTEPPSKQPGMFLSPEFRSPVNALTPADPIGREPIYDRNAPGISAIIHSGKNTEIRGMFSLPGSHSGTARPYGQEPGGKDAPSGGVMLKQTF